ncbi:MAG: hypothetical protein LBQ56_01940 [Synergistaceae bacterium]|jgi:hypothetical protein|nr:hypothetical protein [Synergistaceae bacterium]
MRETKERPIVFSSESVRAILEGRKTQTRRLVDTARFTNFDIDTDGSFVSWQDAYGDHWKAHEFCPYGRPGDFLWVRETFAVLHSSWYNLRFGLGQYDDPGYDGETPNYRHIPKEPQPDCILEYRAANRDPDEFEDDYKWRSPLHMPRWASRITLEVKDVRCERMQDITVSDADKEGFPSGLATWNEGPGLTTGRGEFMAYWNKLNEKHGGGWNLNPWVWVIVFEAVKNA